jgi:dTDP-4-amino-4,6-dideoxygalactose transaminase
VFSLAKFFPCVVGGAVYSKDPEIKKFVNNLMQTAPKNMQLSREIFKNRIQVDAHPSKKNLIKLEQGYAIYDHIFNIRSYSLAVVRRQMKDMALDQRRHHLETIYNEFKNYDYIEVLPNEGISPYMFPLFFEEKICKRIVTLLNENGIESNIYNFDINRNILNPDFKKCVALPCHQGISSAEMDQTVSLVKQGISG